MDFGDWHPDMTIYDQGELYNKIVRFEILDRQAKGLPRIHY